MWSTSRCSSFCTCQPTTLVVPCVDGFHRELIYLYMFCVGQVPVECNSEILVVRCCVNDVIASGDFYPVFCHAVCQLKATAHRFPNQLGGGIAKGTCPRWSVTLALKSTIPCLWLCVLPDRIQTACVSVSGCSPPRPSLSYVTGDTHSLTEIRRSPFFDNTAVQPRAVWSTGLFCGGSIIVEQSIGHNKRSWHTNNI